eukprot:Seg2432.3 transcript_id=Seg2432.3/GoldUCD/mRNA.D3Y31 product="Apelin receptor" protein_id=Seg2432.3/GoldUCD/D3Y31
MRQINERKLLRTVVLVVVIFMVCWMPFQTLNILYGLESLGLTEAQLAIAVRVSKFLQYLNSACNPFIYAFFHPNFRAPMIAVFKNCFDCKKEATNRNLPIPDRSHKQKKSKRQEFADISLPQGSIDTLNSNLSLDVEKLEFSGSKSPRESKHEEVEDFDSKQRGINQPDGEDINCPQSYTNKQGVTEKSLEPGRINEAYDNTDEHEEATKINLKERCANELDGEDIDHQMDRASKQEVAGNRLEIGCTNEAYDTRL